MKIALDLDDTITACPEFFCEMAAGLRCRGHEIFVLTFRREKSEIVSSLADIGFEYDEIVNLPTDFDVLEQDPFLWKASRCRDLGITVAFDDMTDVVNGFPASVFSMLARNPDRGELFYD